MEVVAQTAAKVNAAKKDRQNGSCCRIMVQSVIRFTRIGSDPCYFKA